MGSRAEFSLRQGFDVRPRMLLRKAERLETLIREYLTAQDSVDDVITVGSMRRKQDTVGDLNFIVLGKSAARIFNAFAEFGAVRSWEPNGKSRATFTLSEGRRVTLAWSKPATLGIDSLIKTGSEAHLAELKQRAKLKKRPLSPRSLGKLAQSEAAIYQALSLRFVEPELREGRGEVNAAVEGKLPELITLDDLRGDLHMHTVASDGAGTIEEMADAARSRGYSYIAITDHSQSLKLTNGLTEKRLRQQNRAIDKINSERSRFTILKSAEVDILEDGSLDYSKAMLKELDFTICSIHSRFALGREQQTERIMRAMDNPYFTILGHATGRLLLRREGYEIDFETRARSCEAMRLLL